MRKNKKLELNIGDVIHCRDLDELYDYVRKLTVERYDATVDEKELTITITKVSKKNN